MKGREHGGNYPSFFWDRALQLQHLLDSPCAQMCTGAISAAKNSVVGVFPGEPAAFVPGIARLRCEQREIFTLTTLQIICG